MISQRFSSQTSLQLWTVFAAVTAILISAPVLCVFSSLFTLFDTGNLQQTDSQQVTSQQVWQHLVETVLPEYILNSLILMIGVGIGVLVIGVGTAWLVTLCQFPGSRWLEWALLLPLAAPAYILAYVYTEYLEFYGPVQTTLRNWFGWSQVEDYWFPDIRSIGGAILLLSLTLYPYVYLLTRVSFLEQSARTLEASRSLGCNPWRSFVSVALPLARPAITTGLALCLMETLNDFGTVQFFGVDTFTTGIYRTWFGMGEQVAAAQLASILMLFILGLILLELWSRRQARYYQGSTRFQALKPFQLKGIRGILAFFACSIPLVLGLLLPGGLLLKMTLENLNTLFDSRFRDFASHSFILATVAAICAVIISLGLAYGARLNPNLSLRVSKRIAALGYAVPGSVIAVGILIPVGRLDNAIDSFMRATFGISTGLLLSGTIAALVFAYLVRFLAVSLGSIESSLSKIKPSLDEASASLGHNAVSTLVQIHAPMMVGGLLTAAMLTFVDVMKELPATLVIRPFNFDTLAIRVYNLAADERLAEAAGPALAIVMMGMIPVMILSWRIARSRQVSSTEF
ncbi:MAG: ABC transporter permease [Microcoleaceae cyanobacterium]